MTNLIGCQNPDACQWNWRPDHCQCTSSDGVRLHAVDPEVEKDRVETYRALRERVKRLPKGMTSDEDLNKARRAEADLLTKAAALLERTLPERATVERDQAVQQRDDDLRKRLIALRAEAARWHQNERDKRPSNVPTQKSPPGTERRDGELYGFDKALSIFEEEK